MRLVLTNLALPAVLLAVLIALVVRRAVAGVRAVSKDPSRPRPRSKREQQNRRENWMLLGFLCSIPLTLLIINPLLALFMVWAFGLPDQGFVTDAGVQYWIAAAFPAVMSAIGLGLFARVAEESAPKPKKKETLWPTVLIMYPFAWGLSLHGGAVTNYTASDISARLSVSRFQAEFLQASAEPVIFVFLVSFLSMYAVMLANGESLSSYPVPLAKRRPKPSRRVRVEVVTACYVVMAVVFVLVGRSAGDRYW